MIGAPPNGLSEFLFALLPSLPGTANSTTRSGAGRQARSRPRWTPVGHRFRRVRAGPPAGSLCGDDPPSQDQGRRVSKVREDARIPSTEEAARPGAADHAGARPTTTVPRIADLRDSPGRRAQRPLGGSLRELGPRWRRPAIAAERRSAHQASPSDSTETVNVASRLAAVAGSASHLESKPDLQLLSQHGLPFDDQRLRDHRRVGCNAQRQMR